ncbi:transposase [soil metagenome]
MKTRNNSLRYIDYDYSKEGAYFITICTQDKKCTLGKILNNKMQLSSAGKTANDYLKLISNTYQNVIVYESMVMPNHVHLIIEIVSTEELSNDGQIVLTKERDNRRKMLIPKIMGWYKMNTAKHIDSENKSTGKSFWQRSYYDHIIRNVESYQKISEYILSNPENWHKDKFYKE